MKTSSSSKTKYALAVIFFTLTFTEQALSKEDNKVKSSKSLDQPINLYVGERIPYAITIRGEGVVGTLVEPVIRGLEKSGFAYKWQSAPFSAQLKILKANNKPACSIGAFKTPDREKFLVFSNPIHTDSGKVVFVRNKRDIKKYSSFSDLLQDRSKTLVAKHSYSYGRQVDKLLERYQPPMLTTDKGNITIVKSVLNGEGDYYIASKDEISAILSLISAEKSQYRLLKFKDLPGKEHRYLACNRSVPLDAIKYI